MSLEENSVGNLFFDNIFKNLIKIVVSSLIYTPFHIVNLLVNMEQKILKNCLLFLNDNNPIII